MKTPLALALSALMLAGCFGYGPGAAAPGDTVHGTVRFYDADTGAFLGAEAFAGIVGQEQALGAEVGAALVGVKEGNTLRFGIPGVVGALSFGPPINYYSAGPTIPLNFTQSTPGLTQFLGHPPTVGEEIDDGGLTFMVTAVGPSVTNIAAQVTNGSVVPSDQVGLAGMVVVTGETFTIKYTGLAGSRFTIDGSEDFFYEIPEGTYQMLEDGPDGPRITVANETVDYPQRVGHATVVAAITVEHIAPAGVVSGEHYGVRRSPQLLAPSSEPVAVDDGHGHA